MFIAKRQTITSHLVEILVPNLLATLQFVSVQIRFRYSDLNCNFDSGKLFWIIRKANYFLSSNSCTESRVFIRRRRLFYFHTSSKRSRAGTECKEKPIHKSRGTSRQNTRDSTYDPLRCAESRAFLPI